MGNIDKVDKSIQMPSVIGDLLSVVLPLYARQAAFTL